MIVGNGLIASGFLNSSEDFTDYVIFASGVSNSKETSLKAFKREKDLLKKTLYENQNSKFIYFSSILADSSTNEYYIHNLKMERFIKKNSKNYIIFKLPQIIGNIGNKNNLVNHLVKLINKGKKIKVYSDINRAIIDVRDVVDIVNYCKDKITNDVVKFSHIEKVSVIYISLCIADILDKTINLKISKIHNELYNWNTPNHVIVDEAIKHIGIKQRGYTNNILKKYVKQ